MKYRQPGRQKARAEPQWLDFKARADARAAAWVRGEGCGGLARYARERREARAAGMTEAEKRADSLSSYEFALWAMRQRRQGGTP